MLTFEKAVSGEQWGRHQIGEEVGASRRGHGRGDCGFRKFGG